MANLFKSTLTADVGTSLETIYTTVGVSDLSSTTIIGVTLANTTSSDITADIVLDGGTGRDTVHIMDDITIPSGTTLVPIGGDFKLVLEPGDVLQALGSVINAIDATVSVLEITTT